MGGDRVDYMARALELADLARGRTSPNPPVGAVVVREGRVVGEGFTRPPGGPHAEVVALAEAGPLARGATLYSTLEPCCYHGRTPPCAAASAAAGVTAVHIAVLDPNPRVQGGGSQLLEGAGVLVRLGERAAAARELIEGFTRYVLAGRPLVVAKWAMSLDGKIAAASGDSRWISGSLARERGHQLRDVADAVVVGVGTVLADDPRLTVRLAPELDRRPARPQPWRVVVDSRGRTPLGAQLLGPELAPRTLLATTRAAPAAWRDEVRARGADALELPAREGRVDLDALLRALAERGLTSVLVEGGGALLGSLFAGRLVDRVYAFVAPKVLGGAGAPSPVGGPGVARAADAWPLRDVRVERLGEDLLVSGWVGEEACSQA